MSGSNEELARLRAQLRELETARVAAEEARVAEHAARVAAEEARVAAEEELRDIRAGNVALRLEQEEAARVAEHAARVAAEEARVAEHAARVAAEEELRDIRAVNVALRLEQQEAARVQLGQYLDDYLVSIHRLNFCLKLLVPPPRTTAIPPTLSEGEKAKVTTSGRTSIVGKYYPLKIRIWSDFDQLCRTSFERLRTTLGDRRLFPSIFAVDTVCRDLIEDFPPEFLTSESFFNEQRTSHFLHKTLQKPAQRILNAYLQASGRAEKLYFDNRTAGWRPRSSIIVGATTTDDDGETGGVQAAPPQLPPKTHPDCILLCANDITTSVADLAIDARTITTDTDASADQSGGGIRNVFRVTLAEHKAVHRLRAAAVSRFASQPLDEDIMVQIARVARLGKTAETQEEAAREVKRGEPGQIFFVRALTQAFHYLVSSGIEFGYMATGETLSFLRVPPDDPTTLLYHTATFGQYCLLRPDDEGADDVLPDRSQLAVSMLSALCLLALESAPEPLRRRVLNISQLPRFPHLPGPDDSPRSSHRSSSQPPASRGSSRSSQGRRKGPDDDDDDSNDGDDGDSSARARARAQPYAPKQSSPLKRVRRDEDDRAQDGETCNPEEKRRRVISLRYGSNPKPTLPSPLDPSSFRPIRPYCTQACLRGLVRGEEPDFTCPNVVLHTQALRRDHKEQWHHSHPRVHAITQDELCELVRLQLVVNAEQDCDCFIGRGLRGAIGCLFKITVTGYGYTFVAKGVESFYSHRLRREIRVYEKLAAQQGFSIPVCLGMTELLLPYPMVDGTLVTHMLLMSYVGPPLWMLLPKVVQGVDLDRETLRTLNELQAVGLVDEDEHSDGNLTWCTEVARVIKIDFDQAYVRQGAQTVRVQHTPRGKQCRDDSGEWSARPSTTRLFSTVEKTRVDVESLLLV